MEILEASLRQQICWQRVCVLYEKTIDFQRYMRGSQFHDLHSLFDAHATEIF